jgi:hypothetical protein
MIVYSSLDQSGPKREFLTGLLRIAIKRRYYIKCMRDYLPLFKGIKGNILDTHFPGGLTQPYLYRDKFEEDPFCGQGVGARGVDEEEEKTNGAEGGLTQDQILAMEGLKMQLKDIYNEVLNEYQPLRDKVINMIGDVIKVG